MSVLVSWDELIAAALFGIPAAGVPAYFWG